MNDFWDMDGWNIYQTHIYGLRSDLLLLMLLWGTQQPNSSKMLMGVLSCKSDSPVFSQDSVWNSVGTGYVSSHCRILEHLEGKVPRDNRPGVAGTLVLCVTKPLERHAHLNSTCGHQEIVLRQCLCFPIIIFFWLLYQCGNRNRTNAHFLTYGRHSWSVRLPYALSALDDNSRCAVLPASQSTNPAVPFFCCSQRPCP